MYYFQQMEGFQKWKITACESHPFGDLSHPLSVFLFFSSFLGVGLQGRYLGSGNHRFFLGGGLTKGRKIIPHEGIDPFVATDSERGTLKKTELSVKEKMTYNSFYQEKHAVDGHKAHFTHLHTRWHPLIL